MVCGIVDHFVFFVQPSFPGHFQGDLGARDLFTAGLEDSKAPTRISSLLVGETLQTDQQPWIRPMMNWLLQLGRPLNHVDQGFLQCTWKGDIPIRLADFHRPRMQLANPSLALPVHALGTRALSANDAAMRCADSND